MQLIDADHLADSDFFPGPGLVAVREDALEDACRSDLDMHEDDSEDDGEEFDEDESPARDSSESLLSEEEEIASFRRRGDRSSSSLQSPLETYLREINETRLLSAEEEQSLAARIAVGDAAARDHMVRANLRLVVNIARGYLGKGLGLQDLIEEGNLGLLRAVEGFDPTVGTRFSTYASYWIKQSIKRALINSGKTIRIPAYMVELLSKWRRANVRLSEELGRTPTHEEIARVLGVPKKKLPIIKKAIHIYNATPQVDQPEVGWSLGEMVMDERMKTPEDELLDNDVLSSVLQMIDRLDEREATILRMRFGLDNMEPHTLKEIGEKLGLTRERVRQIETEALGRLADSLKDPRERRAEKGHRKTNRRLDSRLVAQRGAE